MARLPETHSQSVRPLVLIFASLATLVALGGYLYYLHQRNAFWDENRAALLSLSDEKARALAAWQNERREDTAVLAENPVVARAVSQYLTGGPNRQLHGDLESMLRLVVKEYGYSEAILVDRDARIRVSTGATTPLPDSILNLIRTAIQDRTIQFSDFFRTAEAEVRLAYVAPIGLETGDRRAVGAIVTFVDPQHYLYSLIQNWPIPSPSAEALLVAKNGDAVVFLNRLRHSQRAPLSYELPLTKEDLPAVMAVRGQEGIVRGNDYRGIPVLAALRHIPQSPWFLVVKIDQSELDGPLRSAALVSLSFTCLLIALSGAAIHYLWRRQQLRHVTSLYQQEQERKALVGHYDYLTRYANDIIFLSGGDGKILEANDRAVSAYGYSREELLRMRMPDLYPPAQKGALDEKQRVLQHTGSLLFETFHQRKDGSTFPVEISARLINVDGNSFRQAIIRDITDRKRAEAEVRGLNRVLRMLSDCNQALIRATGERALITDLCRIIVESGSYRLAWVGFLPSDESKPIEIAGRYGFAEGLADSLNLIWSEALRAAGPLGTALRSGNPFVSSDLADDAETGAWKQEALRQGCRAIAVLPLSLDGEPFGVLTICGGEPGLFDEKELGVLRELAGDVVFGLQTIRRRQEKDTAEQALAGSEAMLRQAQRVASLGSWEAAAEGPGWEHPTRKYRWSDEVFRIFGVSPEDFVPSPQTFLAAVHPDDRQLVINASSRAIEAGGNYEIEHRIVRPDGSLRFVRERADVLLERPGGRFRLVGTVQDITEYKNLEEQFRQSQKLESIGRLAGGVAHDFNNLLTVINGYGDMLLPYHQPGTPTFDGLNEIRKAGGRAAELTRQLLAFGRKQVLRPQVVNLNTAILDSEKMLRRLLGDDIELSVNLAKELGNVLADATQIHQVVLNLAVNARDAMPGGGRLLIETANVRLDESYTSKHPEVNAGRYVRMSVSDNGVGMDENALAHIFEPFFTTKENGVNTGLGLATAYGIVKQSGGSIWAYSEPGNGTSFKIYLPICDAGEPDEPALMALPALSGTETILVVEDNAEVRSFVAAALKGYGYQVLTVDGGAQALQAASALSGPLHLLLTDAVMPGMTGRQLAEQMYRSRPETRVLYMSGYTENVLGQNGILDPEMEFVQKPFAPADLARKVREVLDS